MSEKVRSFFVSFDAFGEPISVNYKGETSHKTAVGALFTLAIKSFLLIFAFQQILTLTSYDDAAITQYSVLSSRTQGDSFNMGTSKANVGFAWMA